MIRILLIGALFAISLLGSPATVADEPAAAEKVRVQVVLRHTGDKLRVAYQSTVGKVAGLLIPFYTLGKIINVEAHNAKLNDAVGTYPRGPVLAESFERLFPSKYSMFDAKALVDDGAKASDAELIQQARDGGFRYVILVDDQFTGLTRGSSDGGSDDVVAVIYGKIELFDTADGFSMFKASLFANTLKHQPLATALASGDFFRTSFPEISDAFVAAALGQLLRSDNLHTMADSIGQGAQVPALASVLTRYAGSFQILAKAPSGWHVVDPGTPYTRYVEPKSKLRFDLGVRIEVDLLVDELGQKAATIEDYLAAVSPRYAEAGFDISTLAPYQNGALADLPGYTAYSMRKKDGTGGQVMYFRLLDKPFLAMKSVVATQDFDGLLAANRDDIEAALRNSEITSGNGN